MKIHMKNQLNNSQIIEFCLGQKEYQLKPNQSITVEVQDEDCLYFDVTKEIKPCKAQVTSERVEIPDDDGRGNKLVIIHDQDGDIHAMTIGPEGGRTRAVRICTSNGGGRHHLTRRALVDVVKAARADGLGV